jgi:hypothetical protein
MACGGKEIAPGGQIAAQALQPTWQFSGVATTTPVPSGAGSKTVLGQKERQRPQPSHRSA